MPVREKECAGTVSRNRATRSVRQYYGKREERLADRRCGKMNHRPEGLLLPDERGPFASAMRRPGRKQNSAAIVPGIQEHENRAQLVPE